MGRAEIWEWFDWSECFPKPSQKAQRTEYAIRKRSIDIPCRFLSSTRHINRMFTDRGLSVIRLFDRAEKRFTSTTQFRNLLHNQSSIPNAVSSHNSDPCLCGFPHLRRRLQLFPHFFLAFQRASHYTPHRAAADCFYILYTGFFRDYTDNCTRRCTCGWLSETAGGC